MKQGGLIVLKVTFASAYKTDTAVKVVVLAKCDKKSNNPSKDARLCMNDNVHAQGIRTMLVMMTIALLSPS